MRCSVVLVALIAVIVGACSGAANRRCTPVPTFSSPAGECVALEEPPPPPPKVVPKPEPEPEPEPEPPPPEPEPEPEPPPTVVVTETKIELDRTVQFESGKAVLLEDSKKLLDDVAKVLQEHDEIRLVQVEGHTDSVGGNRANKRLSDKRAKAVRAYLIANGVAKKRLVAKGMGEDKPVADNESVEGRFKNRRVDLRILKRSKKKKPKEEPVVEEEDEAEEEEEEEDEEAEKPKPKAKKKKAKKKKRKKKKPAAEADEE